MTEYRFCQVDVFGAGPLSGNPLAVVLGAAGMTDSQMAAFANWTNLSETTFLLPPTDAQADYRVRIFTPQRELPFAGHPTLGSCHAWLRNGGTPQQADIVQQCGVGLVRIRRTAGRLAFAAPPLLRAGPIDPATLAQATAALGLDPAEIVAAQWVDNGPGWLALLLPSRDRVLEIQPDYAALGMLKLGVVGPWNGGDAQFEVRAFYPPATEDPVTGSLNASIAQWLTAAGIAPPTYVASQGTALGRNGRVHLARDGETIWVGGQVTTQIEGTLTL